MTRSRAWSICVPAWKRGSARPATQDRSNSGNTTVIYKELLGTDGDLYTYDAVVLSALVDKGFLRTLPKDVSYENVFPWVMEKSRIRQRS